MAEFDETDLLVDPAIAKSGMTARILALHDCSDNAEALTEWFDTTYEVLESLYVSGAGRYFYNNSGFSFNYSMASPKRVSRANRARAAGIIQRLIDRLPTTAPPANEIDSVGASTITLTDQIFVVHGHDSAALSEVARTLEKLKLSPVILKEQPNRGATIIEKFEANSDVGFAVILMTGDDLGGKASENVADTELKKRARQNVVLELGYFIGKLGRERVCVLKADEVEEPSDIFGVVYSLFDDAGRWKFDLVKELIAAGYNVSADNIL